ILYGIYLLLQQYLTYTYPHLESVILTILVLFLQVGIILYFSTLFLFMVPLIAIENKNILISLEKSMLLVWNHWWRVFSLQLTPLICYLLIMIMIRFVFHVHIHIYFFDDNPDSSWMITLMHLIIFIFFTPWVATLLLLQLKDLEFRKHDHTIA